LIYSCPGVDGIKLLRFLAAERIDAAVILMTGNDSLIHSSAQAMAAELELTVLGTLKKALKLVELEKILIRYQGKVVKKTSEQSSVVELRRSMRLSASLVCVLLPRGPKQKIFGTSCGISIVTSARITGSANPC
jgi:DNA-binding LytR/AlgR family response regulator